MAIQDYVKNQKRVITVAGTELLVRIASKSEFAEFVEDSKKADGVDGNLAFATKWVARLVDGWSDEIAEAIGPAAIRELFDEVVAVAIAGKKKA